MNENMPNQGSDRKLPIARHNPRRWAVRYGVPAIAVVGILALLTNSQPVSDTPELRELHHSHPVSHDVHPQLWTCGMHPQVIQDRPGTCPICHMELTPLQRRSEQSSSGTVVFVDPVVVQNMGIRVVAAKPGHLEQEVRAVGYLEEAEPKRYDVNLRFSGWIEQLHADTEGEVVSAGSPLFEVYSPEVQVAVEELIASKRFTSAPNQTDGIFLLSAKRKLRQLGFGEAQIERFLSLDAAPSVIPFLSPVSGHVVDKRVIEGGSVEAGQLVMRIVDHSVLWLEAHIYEQDLPFVTLGQEVRARVPALLGHELSGTIIFVHPHVNPVSRTITTRVEIPNPQMLLRPGMYATVAIRRRLEQERLLVPREAIIDTGVRKVVFVSSGAGYFEAREVETGATGAGGLVEVLHGVTAGELVVTSGQFLLDAESRMVEAVQKHLTERLLPHDGTSSELLTTVQHQHVETPSSDSLAVAPVEPALCSDAPTLSPLLEAYLDLAERFGSANPIVAPLDVTPLVSSAEAAQAASSSGGSEYSQAIFEAAKELDGRPPSEQRKLFRDLSEAMVLFVESCHASEILPRPLYVASCPMAFGEGARWLQRAAEIRNPYFEQKMKRCGEVTRQLGTHDAEHVGHGLIE